MRREESVTEYQTKPAGASSISHPGERECHEKTGVIHKYKTIQLGRVALSNLLQRMSRELEERFLWSKQQGRVKTTQPNKREDVLRTGENRLC
jgi:hypothetical protein